MHLLDDSGQPNRNDGTRTDAALEFGGSTGAPGEISDRRQTKARALPRHSGSEPRFERPRDDFGGHAVAIVCDPNCGVGEIVWRQDVSCGVDPDEPTARAAGSGGDWKSAWAEAKLVPASCAMTLTTGPGFGDRYD